MKRYLNPNAYARRELMRLTQAGTPTNAACTIAYRAAEGLEPCPQVLPGQLQLISAPQGAQRDTPALLPDTLDLF